MLEKPKKLVDCGKDLCSFKVQVQQMFCAICKYAQVLMKAERLLKFDLGCKAYCEDRFLELPAGVESLLRCYGHGQQTILLCQVKFYPFN